jgi:hypothetical protein
MIEIMVLHFSAALIFMTVGLNSIVSAWIYSEINCVKVFSILFLYLVIAFIIGMGAMQDAYVKGIASKVDICGVKGENK